MWLRRFRQTRLIHGTAALVLVGATVAVVAQSMTAGPGGLDAGPIHIGPWRCTIPARAVPHRRALVLYDNRGSDAPFGAQAAVLAANYLSHYARPVRQPVSDYRPGEMTRYAAVVYVGTSTDALPRSFIADVRAGIRPVLWMGENADQVTNAAYVADHGWRQGPDLIRHFTAVFYHDVRLTIDNNDLNKVDVVHPAQVKVLGTAITSGGSTIPWAVRSGKLTYIAEPLDSEGGQDRSLAVAQIMSTLFSGRPPARHQVLLRLEDVGPSADPVQLRAIANLLASKHIPYSIAAYPVYLGPVTQHPRQRLTFRDRPQTLYAIEYMLSRGGTLVLHGYTHQLGDLRNPNNGESGEDYEFLRVHYNAHHVLIYQPPVPGNSVAWTRHRIRLALAAMRADGLPRPQIWQFPEYGATPAEYRVAASMFVARFERGNYAAGPPGHQNLQTLTEQTPPYLVRDVYGGPLLPETLGYVLPRRKDPSGTKSIGNILASAAVQKAVVRDNVAGVYYHPFLGTAPLRKLVDGLSREGYTFASPCAVLKG
jgi:uncharacterized protein YdaL